jgi:hypothetical protein
MAHRRVTDGEDQQRDSGGEICARGCGAITEDHSDWNSTSHTNEWCGSGDYEEDDAEDSESALLE